MKSIKIGLLAALTISLSEVYAIPSEFTNWPKGTDPKEVGARVIKQFMSTEPEAYQAKGFNGGNYGGGKYVCYSVASLWVNALEYSSIVDDKDLQTKLVNKFRPFLPGGRKQDKVTKPRHVDFNIFGAVPLEIAILNGDRRAYMMGLRYADDQWEPPRPNDRDCLPEWLKKNYPSDETQLAWLKQGYSPQTRLWIDDMYMINVLQTQAYRASKDIEYVRRAAKEMVLYLDKLQLENGLFNHAADVPFRWARGNGWMAAGMPMILQYLKPGDEHYDRILEGYRKMMATLLKYQRDTGLWGQLIDVPESWDETSGSLMFAYGFMMGCRNGWLDVKTYAPAARKAYIAVASSLDENANVPNVCMGTGARNDRQYYFDRKKINGDPHGQAPLLWCVNVILGYDQPQDTLGYPPPGFKVTDWMKRNPPSPTSERLRLIEPVAEGQSRLVPTFASCSFVYGSKTELADIKLEYRKVGGEWKVGEKPIYFSDCLNYRGSIFYLDEDSDYEVRFSASNQVVFKGQFRTWKSEVPVAKTIVIDPATAKYPILVNDQGSPDGWIRYTTKPGVVLGGKDLMKGIFKVSGAKYVLLDNMTLCGGGGLPENPIFIENSCGVRVRNCEIYGFGRLAEPEFDGGAGGKFRYAGTSENPRVTNWDAGIMIYPGAAETVVERCYIHDARYRSNSWYYSHPSGIEGIFLFRVAHSTVLRWNDIIGSDLHRWNDAIEGCDNFGPGGGFNRDADIYGNFAIFCNDDNIELDGGQQNVRCFQNRFESAITAVSIQGCLVSPTYVFDNLLGPCGEEFGYVNPCIKTSTFDPYWYAPYAGIWGNYMAEQSFKPMKGPTSRYDIRDSNVFSTGDVPRKWATEYPVRDLPFMLDTGLIKGVVANGSSVTPAKIVVKAVASHQQEYKVRKNFDADWFDVSPAEGVLKEGVNEFEVTFKPEKMVDRRFWRAAFIVRTPEGLSRCVSVYGERTDFVPPAKPVSAGEKTMYAAEFAPIKFEGAKKGEAPVEFVFEVKQPGKYWAFARVQGEGDNGFPSVEAALDNGKFERTMFRAWSTHPVWNMVSIGKKGKFSGAGLTKPYVLSAGRHTFKFRGFSKDSLKVIDFAISDQPVAFEPR